jgi:hypothetical protein
VSSAAPDTAFRPTAPDKLPLFGGIYQVRLRVHWSDRIGHGLLFISGALLALFLLAPMAMLLVKDTVNTVMVIHTLIHTMVMVMHNTICIVVAITMDMVQPMAMVEAMIV